MKTKSILFDFDDTLIKTFETKKEALKELGRQHYNIELDDKIIRSNWGKPIKSLFEALFNDIDNFDKAIEEYTKIRTGFPTSAYPDTLPTLEKLSKEYLLGIITSNRRDFLKHDFDLTGMDEKLFSIIQTSEECKVHKPEPEVFDYAIDLLAKKGIKRSEVLYIGDTLLDYFAARDAQLKFFGIADRTVPKDEFDKAGAKTITTLSDLLSLGI